MREIYRLSAAATLFTLLAISNVYGQSEKDRLEEAIEKFRITNQLPGMSVVIIRDGQMILKYGTGHGGNQLDIDGDTVFPAASVSKLFAGTLAVRLWQEKKLRDGTKVDLDFNRTTASYLQNVKQTRGSTVTIPATHKHTIKQLFSHLGCIKHYKNDSPQYAGTTPPADYFPKAIDALPSIWNERFVPGCTIGVTQEYSTHAFTYLAAVLEQATGRKSADLIRTEIAEPFDLPTLRATWTGFRITPNPNRTGSFDDRNELVTPKNNSWKVLGGGLEISTADLARFGWKVRNGEIVRKFHVDNLLWKKVNPNQSYGIAWRLRKRGGYNVAEHDGKWLGVRTNLRVYTENRMPIVIAAMTNREEFRFVDTDLNSLSDALVNILSKARRIN